MCFELNMCVGNVGGWWEVVVFGGLRFLLIGSLCILLFFCFIFRLQKNTPDILYLSVVISFYFCFLC